MRITTTGLLLSVLLLGCGEVRKPQALSHRKEAPGSPPLAEMDKGKDRAEGKGEVAFEPVAGKRGPAQAPQEVKRKIIYVGHLDLVVEDMDVAQVRLDKALEEMGGYVAKSEMRGATGSPRDGQWTLRVPVALFDALRKSLLQIGVVTRNSVDSEDVTDRFYDTEARMKNNQVEEEGLRKLYLDKASTSKMEDLLAIRRELTSIRGQIEEQQGQLNRWEKQARLATIQLHLKEVKDYVPPSQPGFGASVSGTFWGSIDALVNLGKGVVLVLAALAPWLPFVALLALGLGLVLRRRPKVHALSLESVVDPGSSTTSPKRGEKE